MTETKQKITGNLKEIKYILIILMAGMTLTIQAQDPQLSQFYAAPLYLAPSFAGSTDGSRVNLNYRNQWPALPKSFVTYLASYDHCFYHMKSGVGILFNRDQAGKGRLATTNISLQYSYHIIVNRKWDVRPGIQFLYSTRSVDIYRLTFGDEMHFNTSSTMDELLIEKRKSYADFSSSLLAYSARYWVGGAWDHMLSPNQSLMNNVSRVPQKFSLFGGTKFGLNDKIGKYNEESLTLTFLYKTQGQYDQFDIGLYWLKSPLVFGCWYRGIPLLKSYQPGYQNNDAIILLIGYRLEDFKIGYSYDFTISRLAGNTAGSHELSVSYEFLQDVKQKKRRRRIIVPCPKL